jgi:hypothetical protein
MISWRKKQLRMLDIEHFHLDQVLLNFVKKNKVSTVMLQGTTDIEYFNQIYPAYWSRPKQIFLQTRYLLHWPQPRFTLKHF